ncbi:MAG: 2-keto-4-pentenoate hydratase, partial [Hyphomicrobiaceae bacterium]
RRLPGQRARCQGLGWETLGWKIAGTTPIMQQRLKSGAPIYGRSYKRFETTSPASLPHGELLDPIIEREFFFRLGASLPPRSMAYSLEEVRNAVDSVHCGVEVAECRFPMASLPPMPAILADGAATGRYVIGRTIPDWKQRKLGDMSVALEINGNVRRTGSGAEVMGEPINAHVWLANERRNWNDGEPAVEITFTA